MFLEGAWPEASEADVEAAAAAPSSPAKPLLEPPVSSRSPVGVPPAELRVSSRSLDEPPSETPVFARSPDEPLQAPAAFPRSPLEAISDPPPEPPVSNCSLDEPLPGEPVVLAPSLAEPTAEPAVIARAPDKPLSQPPSEPAVFARSSDEPPVSPPSQPPSEPPLAVLDRSPEPASRTPGQDRQPPMAQGASPARAAPQPTVRIVFAPRSFPGRVSLALDVEVSDSLGITDSLEILDSSQSSDRAMTAGGWHEQAESRPERPEETLVCSKGGSVETWGDHSQDGEFGLGENLARGGVASGEGWGKGLRQEKEGGEHARDVRQTPQVSVN